jgi:hypothetical protein
MCVILFLQLAHGTIASPGDGHSHRSRGHEIGTTPLAWPQHNWDKDKDSAKAAHLTTGGQRTRGGARLGWKDFQPFRTSDSFR